LDDEKALLLPVGGCHSLAAVVAAGRALVFGEVSVIEVVEDLDVAATP